MRSTAFTNSLFAQRNMNDNHPVKIGFTDKSADIILNKVLLGITCFVAFCFTSLVFGLFISSTIILIAGFAFLFKKETKYEINDTKEVYYNMRDNDIIVEDISIIEEKQEKDDDRFTPTYDISTDYSLFTL